MGYLVRSFHSTFDRQVRGPNHGPWHGMPHCTVALLVVLCLPATTSLFTGNKSASLPYSFLLLPKLIPLQELQANHQLQYT